MLRQFRSKYLNGALNGIFPFYKRNYSYEGDGKTSVSFLNREAEGRLLISGFSKAGFRLNSGLFVVGPIVMFPKTILSWNVANDDDINEDSLALFYNLEPKTDLVVIGLSDAKSFKNRNYYFDKMKELKKSNLNFELLPTDKAIATYNFLTGENRFVAAALIPPLEVDFSDYDLHRFAISNKWSGKDDYMLGVDSADDLIEKVRSRGKPYVKKTLKDHIDDEMKVK